MAKLITSETFDFHRFGYHFTLCFPKSLLCLDGDSGTGKSLMSKALQEYLSQYRSDFKLQVFNYRTSIAYLRSFLDTMTNTLTIIDNADILIKTREDVDRLYTSDNQIVLLGRRMNFYRLGYESCGFIRSDGLEIYTEY